MISKSIIIGVMLLAVAYAAVDEDLMKTVPGYGSEFKQRAWSGYLNTASSLRKIHYVLIESSSTDKDVPITLWLNGGPGCSSLYGFMQQIGPYFLQDGVRYKVGDHLTENPFSWQKLSHLLFFSSPAGVGFSVNNDPSFKYNDQSTAQDSMDALLDFFVKFPELSSNIFWMAGESYAGKYIPDLAYKIDLYNMQAKSKKVNLKGILVGNGIMSFQNGELQRNGIEYMIDREFVDPDLLPYYRGSCLIDPASAGCRYFNARYATNVDEINPYNVYGYCFYNNTNSAENETNERAARRKHTSQSSILRNLIKNKGKYDRQSPTYGAPCIYFDGLVDYFNAHAKQYHAVDGMKWNGPCSDEITGKYSISLRGSLQEYRYLLDRPEKYHVIVYNGDWDDIVPYTDTLANIEKLKLQPTYIYTNFFADGQHAGWTQIFGGMLYVQIKGGSHQVPQSKRAAAYELFKIAMESIKNEISTSR